MEENSNGDPRKVSSRRSKFEIWSEFLEVCMRTPRTQSWLRRNLRLKTSMFKEVIKFLLARDLINQINNFGTIEYLTTEKGKLALSQYYDLISRYFTLDSD
ncbi:MAG: winged helix-turn-helix domain-containing protein [Candidatus Hodarchaeales archaeon]